MSIGSKQSAPEDYIKSPSICLKTPNNALIPKSCVLMAAIFKQPQYSQDLAPSDYLLFFPNSKSKVDNLFAA